jgi:FtsP/CotA-like multicopper oxidase with cupredoxin domain
MDEPWKRFVAVAVAVVAIIVAFTVLQPSDEQAADRGDQAGQTGETTQETDDGEAVGGSQPLLGGARNEPGAEPEPEPVALEFADGEVVGGVETIEVTSGEEVTITVTSDVQEELHIHGVDLYEDLPPGEEVEVTFTPEAEGVFELELHDSATQIASMEVSPS